MQLIRILKRVGVLAVAVTATLLSSVPAQAYPFWQAVNTNANWHCGPTTHHVASTKVFFQSCIVLTPDRKKGQSVLVVRNDASVAISIHGTTNNNFGGSAPCNVSTLNPGRLTGCYGPTVSVVGLALKADGHLVMNNIGDETQVATLL
ncbi:hypothetical protein ACIQPQ_09370 [Streptomyces sp. NPDC091281]|uniref:hypothetical protein n=1 Tax=Streptomyces sp. NPDC091281 TaxID=3365985 RepID=UPI003820E6C1